MIEEILEYNRKFVEEKEYEPYMTSKYPDKKIAILTCMDTRLTKLLPKALGLKNGVNSNTHFFCVEKRKHFATVCFWVILYWSVLIG